MKKLSASLLLLLALLLSRCNWLRKDPAPELPPATQEGKNRFGCRMNGVAWEPKTGINPQLPPLVWEYSDSLGQNGYFHASAIRKTDGIYQGISIGGSGILEPGTYTFKDSIGATYINAYTDCEYRPVAGEMRISKLDKSKRIIAGTFQFTFAEPNCDTVRLTDGRFDFRY
jgi:hypothetical protein